MLKGKKVKVVGLARTGVELVKFLHKQGAKVSVIDIKTKEELAKYVDAISNLNIEFHLGGYDLSTFEESDLIILSPGVSGLIEPIKSVKEKGIKVISEIELASQFIDKPIIAITGTNGKTTTTTLIGKLLQERYKIFVGGNIGIPFIKVLESQDDVQYIVLEVSSFQLEEIEKFRPFISVMLNITDDHLDRYKDFQEYLFYKKRIFTNQKEDDFAILNLDDSEVFKIGKNLKSQVIWFSTKKTLDSGIYLKGEEILVNINKKFSIPLNKVKLVGIHNLENIMASIAVSVICNIEKEKIENVIENFYGLEHRIEFVRTLNGVDYYNDSKGTNVGSVIKALESFERPIILIAGGLGKNGDFSKLRDYVKGKVKLAILIGESKEEIANNIKDLTEVFMAKSLEEAVNKAKDAGKAGDVVLLSPACASFDMFKNYEERGHLFKNYVNLLR